MVFETFLLLVTAKMVKLTMLAITVTFGLQPSIQRMSRMRGTSTSIVTKQVLTTTTVTTVSRSVVSLGSIQFHYF